MKNLFGRIPFPQGGQNSWIHVSFVPVRKECYGRLAHRFTRHCRFSKEAFCSKSPISKRNARLMPSKFAELNWTSVVNKTAFNILLYRISGVGQDHELGFPQYSVLGQLLFMLYLNDWFLFFNMTTCPPHVYLLGLPSYFSIVHIRRYSLKYAVGLL